MDSTNAKRWHWPTAEAPVKVKLDQAAAQRQYRHVIEQAAKHHTDPMDLFCTSSLISFIEQISKKGIKINLHNNEVHIYRWQRPRMGTPLTSIHECRERNQGYVAPVFIDIWKEAYHGEKLVEKQCIVPDYCLFCIPVMVGSFQDTRNPADWMREYSYDSGGFYVCQSGSMGVASERIMPLNLYRRHNHPFMFPAKFASPDKKTASKSFAAASAQYQKYQREEQDENDDEDETKRDSSSKQKQKQASQDICMELRCLHESRQLFFSTTSMSLVLTGYYLKKTEKKSHQLYLLLPKFKPKTETPQQQQQQAQQQQQPTSSRKKKNVRVPVMTALVALGMSVADSIQYLRTLLEPHRGPDIDRIVNLILSRHLASTTSLQALAQIGRLTKDGPGEGGGSDDSEEDKHMKLGHAMLCQQMLPFMGMDQTSYGTKARYLLYLWKLLILRMTGIDSTLDDQDHEVNQRFETNAAAWGYLLRQGLTLYLTNAESSLRAYYNTEVDKRGPIDWQKVFKEKLFSKRLAWCLSTGIWSPKQITKDTRRNMSMALGRTNDATYSSYIRRAATTVKAQDKSIKPRMLQMSHFGRADAGDTSEGEKSGSVRMMTDGFSVSTGSSPVILWSILEHFSGTILLPFQDAVENSALVLLNGVPKAWTRDPRKVCEVVRDLRRRLLIHHEVSVSWENNHQSVIYLLTEPGRCLRPLISLHTGCVELIDASEERNLYIAMKGDDELKPGMTHCELDTSLLFGHTMNTPFAETDQSPRITFQMNMNKQALAAVIHNPLRCQSGAQVGLFYAHRPFVQQEASHGLNLLEMVGTDVTDEDNMVFSSNLLQSGGFLAYQTRTYQAKETGPVNNKIRFEHINQTTGLPEIGAMLSEGQPIMTRKDESIDVRTNDEGQVTRTTRIQDSKDGRAWLTFILQVFRGDKFSSRHGQKVTKSIARRMADMLFDPLTGEIPDVITTLVCLAGRMTAGQLHEMQASLQGCREARFMSGKAYQTPEFFYTSNMLSSRGDYLTYVNGRTGRQILNKMYVGIIFQMRLKHMVYYKEHARGIGPVVTHTRQPTENRTKGSGLRLGEMERDCMVGYGAAYATGERYCKASDQFYVTICKRCGVRTNKVNICQICGQTSTVQKTQMAAATKCFWQLLEALGIIARFEVDHSPLFVKNMDQLLLPVSSPPPSSKKEEEDALVEQLLNMCIDQQQQQSSSSSSSSSATAVVRKRKKRTFISNKKDS